MTGSWGFLTNHALVMVYVVCHSESTVREVSAGVGVTERATLAILRELDDEGIIERHRNGRRNTYSVNFNQLAAYRREGTARLTPREFVDALIGTLLSLSDDRAAGAARRAPQMPDSGALEPRTGSWGFFTHHLLLLLSISLDNECTVREMAGHLHITERAVVAILNQLEDDSIIVRRRQGRRNTYFIDLEAVRSFPRWTSGEWQLPPQLIDVAVRGLRQLGTRSGAIIPAASKRRNALLARS